ncbi:hypothetical protein [Deinococcus maricopensis]|uniref:hypothetical protein n=1 Tax=Deinococcus maricopensis TaxID=309887 RepID=UPI00031971FA|nr:hypothetical protein [Deinococcus maricopensis]
MSEYREYLHESVRNATRLSPDLAPLWAFTARFTDDLELWEELHLRLPERDVRRSLVEARMKILRRKFGA